MSNFGFFDLRLVNPYEVAFREAKSAVKAERVLREAREFPTLAEAVADCSLVVGTTSRGPRTSWSRPSATKHCSGISRDTVRAATRTFMPSA